MPVPGPVVPVVEPGWILSGGAAECWPVGPGFSSEVCLLAVARAGVTPSEMLVPPILVGWASLLPKEKILPAMQI